MTTRYCAHCGKTFSLCLETQPSGRAFCSLRCAREYHDVDFKQRTFADDSPVKPKKVGMLNH